MTTLRKIFAASTFLLLLTTIACSELDDDFGFDNGYDTQNALEELLTSSTDTVHTGGCNGMGRGKHHGFGNDGHGKFNHPARLKGDSIGFAQLPQAAQEFINANKGGAANTTRIFRVTLPDGSVQFSARFADKTHLHFDAAGAVLPVESRDGHKFNTVPFDSLPAKAKAFLLANTDTSKIVHIVSRKKKDGSIFFGVRTTEGGHFHFDAEGNIIPAPPRDKKKKKKHG